MTASDNDNEKQVETFWYTEKRSKKFFQSFWKHFLQNSCRFFCLILSIVQMSIEHSRGKLVNNVINTLEKTAQVGRPVYICKKAKYPTTLWA